MSTSILGTWSVWWIFPKSIFFVWDSYLLASLRFHNHQVNNYQLTIGLMMRSSYVARVSQLAPHCFNARIHRWQVIIFVGEFIIFCWHPQKSYQTKSMWSVYKTNITSRKQGDFPSLKLTANAPENGPFAPKRKFHRLNQPSMFRCKLAIEFQGVYFAWPQLFWVWIPHPNEEFVPYHARTLGENSSANPPQKQLGKDGFKYFRKLD